MKKQNAEYSNPLYWENRKTLEPENKTGRKLVIYFKRKKEQKDNNTKM